MDDMTAPQKSEAKRFRAPPTNMHCIGYETLSVIKWDTSQTKVKFSF